MTILVRNVTSNLLAKLYLMATGILLVPLYVHYLGIEAFGLVAFAAMLQAWFQLLDLGLTPTLAREVARHRGGAVEGPRLWLLFRVLQALFLAVGVLGAGLIAAMAGVMAARWLKAPTLPVAEVCWDLVLLGLLVALRWMASFYSGLITGFERIVWLSAFSVAGATLRCVLVLPAMLVFGANLRVFFGFQIVVAGLELAVLVWQARSLMWTIPRGTPRRPDWAGLRPMLRFSLGLALVTGAWVVATQTDKLILSKLLPLDQYASYSIAVMAAGLVIMVAAPIGEALLPRLARIVAQGDGPGFTTLYRDATQVVCLAALPASAVLVLWGGSVLLVWTGNPMLARTVSPLLALYAGGNAFMVVGAFPYYLQFAKGDLRLHVVGTLLFVILLIPALIMLTLRLGMVGAGWSWLGVNALYFIAWVPWVHGRLAKGMHAGWLVRDVGRVAGGVAVTALILKAALPMQGPRGLLVANLAGAWILLTAAGTAASPFASAWLRRWLASA